MIFLSTVDYIPGIAQTPENASVGTLPKRRLFQSVLDCSLPRFSKRSGNKSEINR
jgi:hypothetical protein